MMELKPSARPALVVLGAGVAAATVLAASFVAARVWSGEGAWLLGLFVVLPVAGVTVLGAFGMAFTAWTTRYHVGGDAIRVRQSFLQSREQRVRWDKVTHAVYRQGPVQRMLGLASVTVVAYGAAGATLNLGPLRHAESLRRHVSRRMLEEATLDSWLGSD